MLKLKIVKKMVAATMCIGLLAGSCLAVSAATDDVRYFEGTGSISMEIPEGSEYGTYYEIEQDILL